jgi:hypothetical protein
MLVSVSQLATYMDIRFSNRQETAAEYVLEGLQSELESYLRRPIELTDFEETYVLESNFVGVPMSSFFSNETSASDDSIGMVTYAQPPQTIYIRNSPIVSVQKVTVSNLNETGRLLGEAVIRNANITSVTVAGTTVTYTASNHGFTVGQKIKVSGLSTSALNLSSNVISSVATNTFTVTQSGLTAGTFAQTGTVVALGNDYTVRRFGIDCYRGFANDIITISYRAGLAGDGIKVFQLMILRAASREMQNMHDDVVGIKDLNPREVALQETGFLEKELAAVKRWRRTRVA